MNPLARIAAYAVTGVAALACLAVVVLVVVSEPVFVVGFSGTILAIVLIVWAISTVAEDRGWD